MSYTFLKYHIVFSTKERRRWISTDLAPRLCQYLSGAIASMGGQPVLANAVEDHVHIAASLPATAAVADCLRDLKANSTNWVHKTIPDMKTFCWQEGYSIFTISPSVLPAVVEYVKSQAAHHTRVDFRDELVWLLKNHGIEFDEKYLG